MQEHQEQINQFGMFNIGINSITQHYNKLIIRTLRKRFYISTDAEIFYIRHTFNLTAQLI